MTSTAASESPLDGVSGLVFFAFPLHQPGKPDTKRAEHLRAVTVPMLFLSGTRDDLADMDLLKPVCAKLKKLATLHPLDTADHGFKTLKRSRTSEEDVFVEMARVVREWASRRGDDFSLFSPHSSMPALRYDHFRIPRSRGRHRDGSPSSPA